MQPAPAPTWRCYEKRRGGAEHAPGARPDGAVEHRAERALRCRSCGAAITSREAALEVDGAHAHTFFNPAGVMYQIGCFARAGGCIDGGEWTDEFTWFPGHRWRFSACADCGTHLGWQFAAASGSRFWGLILDRLEDR